MLLSLTIKKGINVQSNQSNSVFLYVYSKDHPLSPKQRIRNCAGEFSKEAGIIFSANTPLLRTERGKPYFEERTLSFSITHSGDYWVCAVGKNPLGVDLQDERPCKKEAIARRFFHPLEQSFLLENNWEPFFSVWAAKESYVKLTGEGISNQFARFSVVNDRGEMKGVGSAELCFPPFQKGYVLCVCGEQLGEVRLIYR